MALINFILVHEGFFARVTVDQAVAGTLCGNLDGETTNELKANLAEQEKALRKGGSFHRFSVLDGRFHEILFRAAGMNHIWEAINRITTHYDRLCYFDVLAGSSRLRPVLRDHRELYDAMRSNNGEALHGLVTNHLSRFKNLQPFMLDEYKAYFQDVAI